MNLVEHESEFRDLVVKHAAALPPQQRAIADYLLEHMQTVPFMSVPELAERTGVSEATIVRFAQRIGYGGFAELKMELVELLQERLGGTDEGDRREPGDDVLESVATLEAGNIRRTVEGIDRSTFTAVADAVFRAEHTFTFGMGVSAHLAELAAYTLVQIGVRATTLSTRYSSPREQLVAMRPSDILIALSFPPYSRQTLEMLEEARDLGAATVAVCDRLTAPAASLARWALQVKTDNMMFTNAVAAMTVVFNALATEIATSHRGRAIEAFSRINRILTEDADVIAPER
jgi:DNA-binding MurR/RpiR family transcriptional regulator